MASAATVVLQGLDQGRRVRVLDGCWDGASVPHLVGCFRDFECPYDLAAGSPQREWSEKESREEATTLFVSTVDWMFVYPRNSQVESLTPRVMVLGGGAFGR